MADAAPDVTHKHITSTTSLPAEAPPASERPSYRQASRSEDSRRRSSRKTRRRRRGSVEMKRANSDPENGTTGRKRCSSRRASLSCQGLMYRQLSHRQSSYDGSIKQRSSRHGSERTSKPTDQVETVVAPGPDHVTPEITQPEVTPQKGAAPGDEISEESEPSPANVDSGWAWVVMTASMFFIVVSDGLAFSFGVILPVLHQQFPGQEEQVALVGSVMGGVHLMAGPLASVLCDRLGYRVVALTGSILAAVGLTAGSFAPNVELLIFTYGVLGGLGFSFIYLSSMVITSLYFEKKRPLAVGIASCGSGLGMVIFPFIVQELLDVTSWRNVVRVEAGMVLLLGLGALTFRPLPHLQNTSEQSSCKDTLLRLLDIRLFKNPAFILLSLMAMCSTLGIGIPVMFLPDMAIDRGVEKDPAAFLVSIVGISNVVGRVGVGALVYWLPVNPMLLLAAASASGALMAFLNPLYTTYPTLATFAAIFGMTHAFDAALATVIIAFTLGTSSLSGVFGLHCLFRGIINTISGPAAAALKTHTGSYNVSFYMAGAAIVLNGALSVAAFVYRHVRGVPYPDDESTPDDVEEDTEDKEEEYMSPIVEENDNGVNPTGRKLENKFLTSVDVSSFTSSTDELINQTV